MATKNLGEDKIWVMKHVFFCFILFSGSMGIADQSSDGGSDHQTLEIHKLLRKLNTPAVKSIKSPDGDIIDCVHILNQPAFKHPRLRNHKIQMRLSFHPEGNMFEENEVPSKSEPISQLWHQSGNCPEGTIPIRRIRKQDILRAESIHKFGKNSHNRIHEFTSLETNKAQQHQFATVYVNGDKYYGGKATMNLWNPMVQKHNEFSNSQMGIQNGDTRKGYDSIQAGWQVNPQLYGDNNTRLFTFWTADSGKTTGCYDMLCSGFVQLDNGVSVGASVQPLSVYGDPKSQFDMTILIWKDPINGDWWMQYGRDRVVGYWPSSLFSRLSGSATAIQWGGEVLNLASDDGKHTTTEMGSGHFGGEGVGRSSYFSRIKIVNGKNQSLPPPNGVATYTDNFNCYTVQMGLSDDEHGAYFYFGGPGRNPACP